MGRGYSWWASKEPRSCRLLTCSCGLCYLQFRNIQIEDLAGIGCIVKYSYHYGHTPFCVPLKVFLRVPIAGTSVGSLRKHDSLSWGTGALLETFTGIFKHIWFDLAHALFFMPSISVKLAHRKRVLALQQCDGEGNTHLHQALGPVSCSVPTTRKWVPPSVPFLKGAGERDTCASPSPERARRDALWRDVLQRDALLPYPRWRWSFCSYPPSAPGGTAIPAPQQHILHQVSTWHNFSFSWASGKAEGGRQWLLACWSSQHLLQPAQHTLWFRDQRDTREDESARKLKFWLHSLKGQQPVEFFCAARQQWQQQC